jgi:hypothetical protein
MKTFQSFSNSLNDSSIILGRRREKDINSSPEDYLGQLVNMRQCGTPGFSLSPNQSYVQISSGS